jgi:tetratricopeptide (TPR) repeat protein
VISVLAGTETQADVERLELAFEGDLAAAHALAYRARRYGMVELSRERLESISERAPDDAVALANLGNIEMRRGETEQAIEFYERSAAGSDSPVLLFDLSQAYANAFRMEEYEATLVHAQHLGDAEVSALSSLGDASLVSDLGFPMALLQDRLRSVALSERSEERAISALAPGRLGDAWYLSAGAFLLVALLSLLLADRWDHASQCGRCGHRICTRCEETVWSDEICEDCHYLFQNPEATDPSLRMARLQALAEREVGIERIWLAVSLFIPGMAGFASRRPDFALFGLLLFCWIAVWAVWPSGIFEDPMLMGSAAVLCFAIPGLLAVFAYASLVCVSLIARKNR